MTRTYELVYVIRPDATEQQITDLHTQVEQIVSRTGGAIARRPRRSRPSAAAASSPTRSAITRKASTSSK